jgi:uncharacterized protein
VATDRALYTDSSALVKLIVEEPESAALRTYAAGRELLASELVLAEVPRAIQRLATTTRVPRRRFARGLERVLGAIALLPLEREVLLRAGAFDAPFLRALDAIQLAAALSVADVLEGFVSYDERQIEAAQIAGLPVVSPA